MLLKFGPWTPDLPERDNPGLVVAKNALPLATGYSSVNGTSVYGSALSAQCLGAISGKDISDNTYNFAGDATKLYQLGSAAWADVSVGGGYSTASGGQWEFTVFGNRIVATNYDNVPQSFVMGTSSAFANLGGSPPNAKHIATVRNFVVLGDTNDGVGGHVNNRIWWSGLNNAETWTASQSTQAGSQDLASGGKVKAIIGGEYGSVFMENSLYRMTYVGAPLIWQFDEIEGARGTTSAKSCVKNGNLVAYAGIDGFYMWDGSQSIPIGNKQINSFFFQDIDPNYVDRVIGVYDPYRELIFWSYVSLELGGTNNNRLIVFNRSRDSATRWTIIDESLETLFLALSEGYNVDNAAGTGYNVDTSPYGPDSPFWVGKRQFIAGFNTDHKMVTFDGSPKTAIFETGDFDLSGAGRRVQVEKVRPAVEGTDAVISIKLGYKNIQDEDVSYTDSVSPNTEGFCNFRTNARFHRAQTTISGGFDCAYGVEPIATQSRGLR